nr:uncharacterized protein LOC125419090 [Ziziphus jujuba var. spinosa]
MVVDYLRHLSPLWHLLPCFPFSLLFSLKLSVHVLGLDWHRDGFKTSFAGISTERDGRDFHRGFPPTTSISTLFHTYPPEIRKSHRFETIPAIFFGNGDISPTPLTEISCPSFGIAGGRNTIISATFRRSRRFFLP